MTRAARALWAALVAALLTSCGGGGYDDQTDLMASDWHAVVDTEFSASGSNGWFTCRSSAVDCFDLPFATDPAGTGYGMSSFPWWVDPNHAPPGLGYAHLVAYAYHIDCVREGIIEPPRRSMCALPA